MYVCMYARVCRSLDNSYMYICMHINNMFASIFSCIHIDKYIHTSKFLTLAFRSKLSAHAVYIHSYIHTYTHLYARIYTGMYARIYSEIYARIYTGMYARIYSGIYARIYSGIYAHIYCGIYAHMYMQSFLCP